MSKLVEPAPQFQANVENADQNARNAPDIAAVSDANPAVPVYISTPVEQCKDHPAPDQYMPGWTQLKGTSLATPIVAAITNAANHGKTSVPDELGTIYGNRKHPSPKSGYYRYGGDSGRK